LFKKYFINLNFKKKIINFIKININKLKTPFNIILVLIKSNLIFNKVFYNNNYINVKNNVKLQKLYLYTNYSILLVSLNFNDFYCFLNTFMLLFGLWLFFFKLNTNFLKITSKNSTNINPVKLSNNSTFLNFYYYLVFYKLVDTYTIHGKNSLIWFNHFNLNNFTLNLLYIFTVIALFLFLMLKFVTKRTNLVKSIDYLFSINNIVLLLPYLFFVNTVFTFLFLLELISVILLYKLISSKIWFKNFDKSKQLLNNIPQNYINMVFFQYWITFFSTIFIIYFYINMFYMYGTTDWFLIQFLNSVEGYFMGFNVNLTRVLLVVFLLSVFFKLGLTPFHLFKVEVYKGLPYLSIFFYTTYYFVVLFIFFIFLLSDYLFSYITLYYLFLVFLLVCGSFYIIFLMFDVNLLKAFFTYSTVINTVGFLTAFIATL
jgi:hypothetical protein